MLLALFCCVLFSHRFSYIVLPVSVFCPCFFLPNIACGLFAHSSIYSEVASHVNDAVVKMFKCWRCSLLRSVLQTAACMEHLLNYNQDKPNADDEQKRVATLAAT